MLLTSESGSVSEFAAVLNDNKLKNHDYTNNYKEDPVGNKTIEDIPLSSTNLSAVEFIEDVHPDE